MALGNQFQRVDTKRPAGVYVRFERRTEVDEFSRNMAEEFGQADEMGEYRTEMKARALLGGESE